MLTEILSGTSVIITSSFMNMYVNYRYFVHEEYLIDALALSDVIKQYVI